MKSCEYNSVVVLGLNSENEIKTVFQSIIYYTIRSAKLDEWLNSSVIRDALKPNADKNFVDLDPLFNMNIDEDFDFR